MDVSSSETTTYGMFFALGCEIIDPCLYSLKK